MCGQCSHAGRPGDCEYTDAQGRSRTTILEERIAVLEARIRELEDPDSSDSPILLHDPFQTPGVSPSPAPSIHSIYPYVSATAGEAPLLEASFDPWMPAGELRRSRESSSHLPALGSVSSDAWPPEDQVQALYV